MSTYIPERPSRSTFHRVRGLDYHLRHWGDPSAPPTVMVHGWMDVSASFQFLVDAFDGERHVAAPDWRGYGRTAWSGTDSYWLPDYLADLDALLDHLSPDAPVDLVAHSLGGNMALLYAGARPERIRRLVNLEGLGIAGSDPDQAPARFAKWLAELRDPPTLSSYDSLDAVIGRLRKNNPRLPEDRARFLAAHWAEVRDDGRWHLLGDPAHKVVNPYLYRADEVVACWSRITAPVLWVMARDSDYAQRMDALPDYADRIARIADVKRLWIADAGHMLHHDQPETLARAIEDFLA